MYNPKCIDIDKVMTFVGRDTLEKELSVILSTPDALNEYNEDMDVQELFDWSTKYGFVNFCKYMYINENVKYVFSKENYIALDTSDTQTSSSLGVPLISGENTSFNMQSLDKLGIRRTIVLNFLYNMRKYSRHTYRDKKHIWMLNKKYIDMIPR